MNILTSLCVHSVCVTGYVLNMHTVCVLLTLTRCQILIRSIYINCLIYLGLFLFPSLTHTDTQTHNCAIPESAVIPS